MYVPTTPNPTSGYLEVVPVDRLTPTERRVLARTSWFRDAWFATGKPVYRLVTRRILGWRDNEGRGPRL